MGLCESCFGKSKENYDGDEPPETDPLLNSANGQAIPTSYGEAQNQSSIPQQGDEQSALSRILNVTESNVIDVTQVGGKGIEQHEYHDKAKLYKARITAVLSSCNNNKMLKPMLPVGVSAPQIILASHPVLYADVELMKNAAAEAAKAMREVRVEHKENLVVAFAVT